jgi:glucose-1-phosphate adenylyltransferase
MPGSTKNVLGMILAGGEGNRLYPLTEQRAKPAVPFGGKYRLIDFALSNFINSSVYSVYVLTQFKSQSLTEHINESWRFGSLIHNHFILPVPAQKRTGDSWYQGTADAIYQNINLIEDGNFDFIAVFGADHIYRMDLQQMIDFHVKKKADVTVSAIPVPIEDAKAFGVIQVQEKFRIIGFQEKPKRPKPIPGREKEAFASMGNYLFNKDFMIDILYKDAKDKNSSHDFGKDILPKIFNTSRVYAYDFRRNRIPGISKKEIGYWRDVGTIKAFWEANMDLRSVKPDFNLYNKKWPIRTASYGTPPAKFVFNEDGRRGQAIDSIIGEGSIISGGKVQESVIGREVLIDSGAEVKSSLIMDRVKINKDCKIQMAIIDKDVEVPSSTEIGYDLKQDKKRFFVDKESGIIVIPKGYKFS